jgi:hypothetical protein
MDNVLTVTELLAAPQRFDRLPVTVSGYYVGDREHLALYPSPAEVGTAATGIWLRHEATVGGQIAAAQLNRSWIRLVGVFHNRSKAGAGHFNAFPAYISEITQFGVAKGMPGWPTCADQCVALDRDGVASADGGHLKDNFAAFRAVSA